MVHRVSAKHDHHRRYNFFRDITTTVHHDLPRTSRSRRRFRVFCVLDGRSSATRDPAAVTLPVHSHHRRTLASDGTAVQRWCSTRSDQRKLLENINSDGLECIDFIHRKQRLIDSRHQTSSIYFTPGDRRPHQSEVARRIGQRISLHRPSDMLKLPPFDANIHRHLYFSMSALCSVVTLSLSLHLHWKNFQQIFRTKRLLLGSLSFGSIITRGHSIMAEDARKQLLADVKK